MRPEFEKVFVDTNILIYSTFEDFEREKHLRSTEILHKLQQEGTIFFISSQILREYFAITTNNSIFKKPLTCKQAASKMREFISQFIVVNEKKSTINVLIGMIEKYAVSRGKVHDMNIVAAMIDNDIVSLLTYNLKTSIKSVKFDYCLYE